MVCLKVLCHELGYYGFRSLRNDCVTLITLFHYPFAICSPHPTPQKSFGKLLFLISPGYCSCPRRNWRQYLCNFCFGGWGGGGLGGKQGALWENCNSEYTTYSLGCPIIAFLYLSCIKSLEKEFCSVNSPSKQPLSLHMHQKTFKKSQLESHQPVWKCVKATTGCTLKPGHKTTTTTRHNILPFSRDNQKETVKLHSYLYLSFFSVSCDS